MSIIKRESNPKAIIMYKTIVIHTRSTYWSGNDAYDEAVVDADELAAQIQDKCNELGQAGYEVFSIMPINSGNLTSGNGYIHAESVLLTARKINS